MAMTIHVDIVSAEAEIYSGSRNWWWLRPNGRSRYCRAARTALTRLKPGEVRVRSTIEVHPFFISAAC